MTTSLPNNENKRPSDGETAGRPLDMGRVRRRPLFSLGGRLALCASFVRPGTALADVGTDHAYLPIWLAKKGLIRSAVASDVRPGPLRRARANIARYGGEGIVSVRLCDGLSAVAPEEAEDVVLAGMGGLMIARILGQAPWLRDGSRRLILQPMTSAEDLRAYLAQAGFAVLRERAAEEDGHVYSVMQAAFRPEEPARGGLYPYIGAVDASTPGNRRYLSVQMLRLEKRARGLRITGESGEAERLARFAEEIGRMLALPGNGEEGGEPR